MFISSTWIISAICQRAGLLPRREWRWNFPVQKWRFLSSRRVQQIRQNWAERDEIHHVIHQLNETLPWRWFDPVVCSDSRFPIPYRWPYFANYQSSCSLASYSPPFLLLGHLCWSCFSTEKKTRISKHKWNRIINFCEIKIPIFLLGNVTSCRANSIAIIHDSGWLIVDNFTIIVAFPRSFVFLELGWPKRR